MRVAVVAFVAMLALGSSSAIAQNEPVIHVGSGPVDGAASVFYADHAGLFQKYGLNVQLERLPNGAAILSAIAGGSLELGQGSVVSLIQGVAKGLPFTAVGSSQTYDSSKPDYGLLVPIDSPVKTAKDLEGKTFGVVSLQDQNTLATFAWLDAHGVDRSTLKFVEMPASSMLAAMEQGRIDAATFYEPFYSSFMATGKVRALADPYSALGKHYVDSLLYGNTQWVDAHRDLVVKFLQAVRDAGDYVGTHEAEVVPITAQYTGANPSTLMNMHHGGRTVALTPAELQPIIDAAAKYGMIAKAFPASDMICGCALQR